MGLILDQVFVLGEGVKKPTRGSGCLTDQDFMEKSLEALLFRSLILLMAEILHQLIGSFPIICKVFTSQVVQDFSHQQYDRLVTGSLLATNSQFAPENRPLAAPKGLLIVFQPSHFQVRLSPKLPPPGIRG